MIDIEILTSDDPEREIGFILRSIDGPLTAQMIMDAMAEILMTEYNFIPTPDPETFDA